MKNKFRVVHFSNSIFLGKLKNENELHKIRFSFRKEVQKTRLSRHFSFFIFQFCEKMKDPNFHALLLHPYT